MKSLFKIIVRTIKMQLTICRFRAKVINKGGFCGRGLYLTHPELIGFERLKIKSGFRLELYPEYAGIKRPSTSLHFSNNVIIGYNFTALVADRITIGADTIIASNVSLVSENHGTEVETPIPFYAQPLNTGPISIGEGCWIGQNVIVLPNVHIGDKCVIGANSVVNRDIPPYSIAAGMPAKVIKRYDFDLHMWKKVNS